MIALGSTKIKVRRIVKFSCWNLIQQTSFNRCNNPLLRRGMDQGISDKFHSIGLPVFSHVSNCEENFSLGTASSLNFL